MNEERNRRREHGKKLGAKMLRFPYPIAVAAFYVFFGMLTHLWHPLWMIFLTIPAYYQYACALKKSTRRGYLAALPVVPVSVILFLIAGFAMHLWKYAWVIFIADLFYYWYVGTNVTETEE